MLIGICGGICAGKKTVAQYLVDHHNFKRLHLAPTDECEGADVEIARLRVAGGGGDEDSSSSSSSSSSRSRSRSNNSSNDSKNSLCFATAEALLGYVTTRWQGRFVTTDITTEKSLDVLLRRPFFLLLSVDAPVTVRWRRHRQRCSERSKSRSQEEDAGHDKSKTSAPTPSSGSTSTTPGGPEIISLDDFVARSDAHLYSPDGGLQFLISRATVRLLNTSSSLAHLYATLGKLDIPNGERLRPGWDTYFMSLAALAAQRSNCMKRRVGCVLVGRERRVISTGYNGTPRGIRNCADGGCARCNAGHASGIGLATCLCIHAEENALLEAGRERIRDGAVLYCDTCPCLTCSIKICQVGIGEVVYAHGYSMDREAAAVFGQAGVRLRQFVPPPNGLIHLEKMELYS